MSFIQGINLENKGVGLMLRDDYVDQYEWDPVTATGKFAWRWWSCCTDGMILGPLPYTNYSLDIFVNRSLTAGIKGLAVMSFNYSSNDVDYFIFDEESEFDSSRELRITGQFCSEYCREFTNCGVCTADAKCAWVEGEGCVGSPEPEPPVLIVRGCGRAGLGMCWQCRWQ